MLHVTLAYVIALLGQVADAPTPDELVRQVKDPEPRTRRLAAEALGRQKVEAAVPALAELLKDKDTAVRGAATAALARIGPKAVPALAAALAGDDELARAAALTALDRIGPGAKGAIEPLAAALKSKSTELRIRAAVVLGKLGADAKPALPALFDAARTPRTADLVSGQGRAGAAAATAAALKIDPTLLRNWRKPLCRTHQGLDSRTPRCSGSRLARWLISAAR